MTGTVCQPVQLLPHQRGIGVTELVENGQGAAPGGLGRGGGTVGQVGVAQAGQGIGLVVTIPEFAVQVQRLLIAGNGLLVAAEAAAAGGDAVERVGLAELVADLLLQREGLAAVDEPLVGVF